jgi:hypothetical protein
MRRHRWLSVVVALLAVSAAGVLAAPEKAAAKKSEEGWKPLFNGKTLDGWEKHGGKAEYAVEDGMVVGHSTPNTQNTFLCTKERFGDFELVFDIKENDRVWGPQVEIAASPDGSGYIYGEATGRGWLSQERPKTDVFKNGEWNEYRVLCKGANIKTWVNGQPVADLTDEQSAKEGLIGLQVHAVGGREEPLFARWRNIKIRKLP